MIRYELTDRWGYVVGVFLDVDRDDQEVEIQFDGRDTAVDSVRFDVPGSPGMYGGPIGERTTGRNLWPAMRAGVLLQQYKPRLVEGHEILDVDRDA